MPDKPFEIDGFERSEVKRAFYTMVNALAGTARGERSGNTPKDGRS